MGLLDAIKDKARTNPQCMAFPEAHDEKIMRAAAQAVTEGLITAVLVGDEDQLRALCDERDIAQDTFEFISNTNEEYLEDLAARYAALPDTFLGAKAVLRRFHSDNISLALAAEAVGDIDATLAGIEASTGEVILAGQMMIGMAPGIDSISSVALGEFDRFSGGEGGAIAFGDSAVIVKPSSQELADIAISSCDTIHALTGWTPRCALLSFSTCGSGQNEVSEVVQAAVAIAREKRPDLAIDGEFQLDAATNPAIAARKVKRESEVAGKANIIIFPDLNAGNIGVKIFQRFAGADAIGPFLQGFKKIVCDCSRGASVSELVGNIACASVRAAALKEAQ